jgi:hypothetical protein
VRKRGKEGVSEGGRERKGWRKGVIKTGSETSE